MSDSDTTGRLSDRIRTTRRQLLAAVGGTAAVGSMATGTSDTTDESEDAIQAGGLAADLTEQKRRETYVTANPGALDASVLKSGELFYATDGELGVWDGEQKQHLPVGSQSNPVPEANIDDVTINQSITDPQGGVIDKSLLAHSDASRRVEDGTLDVGSISAAADDTWGTVQTASASVSFGTAYSAKVFVLGQMKGGDQIILRPKNVSTTGFDMQALNYRATSVTPENAYWIATGDD